MRIDLYAQCWNEEVMLPFFFRHYDPIVDRYVIYDDGSTDRTWEMLAAHPRVEARRLDRAFPQSHTLSQQALADRCWKESRGAADWVVIVDVDEHLFHPAMRPYLAACRAAGVTLIPALGFQMISERVPGAGALLCETVTNGTPWAQMMKPGIFDPDAVEEINFVPGRHTAEPAGRLCVPARDEVRLLHYKYLGREATQARHRALAGRRGAPEFANNWCHRWSWSASELADDWQRFSAAAVDVRGLAAEAYPVARWWLPRMATAGVAPGAW